MMPRIDPKTFARPRPAQPSPTELSRRRQIRALQAEVTGLRQQLAAATAMYAISQSPIDLVRQQQASMALERCLHQLRRLARP